SVHWWFLHRNCLEVAGIVSAFEQDIRFAGSNVQGVEESDLRRLLQRVPVGIAEQLTFGSRLFQYVHNPLVCRGEALGFRQRLECLDRFQLPWLVTELIETPPTDRFHRKGRIPDV